MSRMVCWDRIDDILGGRPAQVEYRDAVQERQNAYTRARTDLAGLIALAAATMAGIERKIVRELQD